MLSLSIVVVAASLAQTADGATEVRRDATEHRWQASLQVGAGMLGAQPGALVRPRLGYDGPVLRVAVAAPLWLRFDGSAAPAGVSDPASPASPASSDRFASAWATDWEDPETYAAMLEHFTASTPGNALALEVGAINQLTLGTGVLVRDYAGSLDPTRRRTGARVRLNFDRIQATVMCDSIVQPALVAAQVALAPLPWIGHDRAKRFRLHAGVALDVDAPTETGSAPFGGGSFGASYRLWQSEHVALESYVTGAFLSAPGLGAHLGVRLQLASDEVPDDDTDALVLQLEGVTHGAGYSPGYFDIAYRAERIAVDVRGGRPKASVPSPAGFALRGSADVRIRSVRFGLAADSGLRGRMSASVYVRVELDRWSAAAMLVKRNMRGLDDFWQGSHSTWTVLEGSARIYAGMFVFATLHHGWREVGDRDRVALGVVTDWMAGIGYAVGGES